MPHTIIAQVHDQGPGYVVLSAGSAKLDVLNAALAAYLGDTPLTPDVLLDIMSAGVRALDRETATAAAVHLDSARTNLSDAAEQVVRTVNAVPEHTARMVSDAVARTTSTLPDHIAAATRAAAVSALDPNTAGTPAAALVAANRTLIGEFTAAVSREIVTLSDGVRLTREAVLSRSAAEDAAAIEREKSSAKGADFETVLAELLAQVCEAENLVLRDTSTVTGAVARSKKGDFTVSDESRPLVVVEAKNAAGMSPAAVHAYLDEATRNRGVSAAVWAVNGVEQNRGELVRFLSPNRVSVAVTGADSDAAVLRAVLRCAVSVARKDTSGATVAGVRERLGSLAALDASLRRMVTEAESLTSVSRSIKTTASEVRAALAEAVSDLLTVLDSEPGSAEEGEPVSPFDTAAPSRVAALPTPDPAP